LIWKRVASNPNLGLDLHTATYRLQQDGKNAISSPKNNIVYKILEYLLGGFCGLFWFAAILAILSYKPLGEPNPSPLNLALGIVLVNFRFYPFPFFFFFFFNRKILFFFDMNNYYT
jgi:sodium/potassium-transporting ATPase subunit alpha